MTNAEKYEEVFGVPPDITRCPTADCDKCFLGKKKRKKGQWWCVTGEDIMNWWNSKYKGGADMRGNRK